ncbi:TPA: hypothetical protein I8303_003503 [Aeromonas hydrophila]|nr:hypothetical protein [Aeromonas hydrophila]
MKSSDMRRWLEQQEALHGEDLEVVCMTAIGNLAEGERLSENQLMVTTPSQLPIAIDGIEPGSKVIAIGCGCSDTEGFSCPDFNAHLQQHYLELGSKGKLSSVGVESLGESPGHKYAALLKQETGINISPSFAGEILNENPFSEMAEILTAQTGVVISSLQAAEIMVKHPQAQVLFTRYGADDTGVCDALADSISQYFLGHDWPLYGDKVNVDDFIIRLRNKAKEMGFTCVDEGKAG